jgi:hypothetical protein
MNILRNQEGVGPTALCAVCQRIRAAIGSPQNQGSLKELPCFAAEPSRQRGLVLLKIRCGKGARYHHQADGRRNESESCKYQHQGYSFQRAGFYDLQARHF